MVLARTRSIGTPAGLNDHKGGSMAKHGEVTITIERPIEAVFDFLADLENHWLLTGAQVEVLDLEGPPGARVGGRVRLRGPLGLGRQVATQVMASEPPTWMAGTARLGNGTAATVSWTLAERDGRVNVALEGRIGSVSPWDRLLLALGGRWWMRRLFRRTLLKLSEQFERAESDRRGSLVTGASSPS
jgi:hypothetical protein